MRKEGGDMVKKLFVLLLVFGIVAGNSVSVYAADDESEDYSEDYQSSGMWMESNSGWWYQYNDTTWPTGGWFLIDGLWYFFDADGILQTGWLYLNENWYYTGSDGAMYTGWLCYGGKWYFFDEDGHMVTGWLQDGEEWYYMKPAGNMLTGWVYSDGYYYYCDRSTGKLRYDYTVNGIYVNEAGQGVLYGNDYYKIDTMIMADDIVDEYITAYADDATRIYECCRYVMWYPYWQYRTLKPYMDTDYWASMFARDIFVNGRGCCVSEAAALAFLFTELNVGTAYVDNDTGHAWVEMNGRYWDPLFAEAKGMHYLNMSPSDYYTNHPVGWSEI